ncbi:MAG: hypothetical protein OXD40_07320 [bacterium]|nr:hypothetical protein [bacterium]
MVPDLLDTVRVVRDGLIAGAGLDVFENEPTSADETPATLDNVILAPHALCWTGPCSTGSGGAPPLRPSAERSLRELSISSIAAMTGSVGASPTARRDSASEHADTFLPGTSG